MPSSFDGFKPAQLGLVDMGNIQFYNAAAPPPFALSDLDGFKGSFSEIVLNVTWAQLQAAEDGPLTTSAIDSAIAQVVAYNAANGTDVGIKLRVWGGYTAPEWAKNIDGPPITIDGRATVNFQIFGPQQIGRIWSADYNDAWTGLQNQLAALYDSNPVIRGISNTAGAPATDEPFVPVNYAAPLGPGSGAQTVNQIAELVAGGYSDAAEMLTLRASIADYSQWSTTPLDYTMNCFFLQDDPNNVAFDPNFTLAVLQQARNSSRLVQAGNHALSNPLYATDSFVYAQMGADAALDPAAAPGSYQTNVPGLLVLPGESNTPPGSYLNWPDVVSQGIAANAGDIELWDWPTGRSDPGFTLAPSGLIKDLHTNLASGIAPLTGAPADGSALDVVAPAFVTGAPGTVAFSGTDAVLLAGATPLAAVSVTLTSLEGGRLGIADLTGTVIGPASGPSLTLSGPIAALNTVLAHLTDTLQSGTDVVQIVAVDGSGNTAVRDVGIQISPAVASPAAATPGLLAADQRFAFGGGNAEVVGQGQSGTLDIAARLGSSGTLVVGGVQSALAVAGDLTVDGNTTLLAALAPGAYSSASLTVGGTFDVRSGGAAYFSGLLGAAVISNGGAIRGNGTLAVPGSGTILNDGTIEAVADRTLGAQRLVVGNDLAGAGVLIIDPGATLVLDGQVQTQSIQFAANSSGQLSTDPYSPSTLVLKEPSQMTGSTIGGFTFADRLVLDNVAAVGTPSYAGGILTVDQAGGLPPLTFTLSGTLPGDLAGLDPIASVSADGSQTTIRFAAPSGGIAPGVVPHAALRGVTGVRVVVPDIVLRTPLPDGSIPTDELIYTATIATNNGGVLRADDLPTVGIPGGTEVSATGSLAQIERNLQSLTYQAEGATDQITVTITDSANRSGQTTIAVDNTPVPGAFAWQPVGGSSDFADPANWTVGATPPGGANVALFGAGSHMAAGNGAVGQILDVGTTTLTGDVTAQGIGGVALVVDSGGALTLAGGALLTAQQQATVGGTGQGLLTLMGGALAASGPSAANALVIGELAGSNGTVLNLEQIAANASVVVGAAGSGTLELLGVAASVLDGGADIGQSAGGQGSAIVNGGEWTTSGQLTVGDAGSGALLIDGMNNGTTGQATAFNATVGAQAGSQGSVMLDGGELLVANASAASSTLAVGAGGTGDLAIEDGSEAAVGAAQGTGANDTGVLAVGGTAGGRGRIRIGSNGALLVYGNAAVGGTAGSGAVIVGESADDTASFALIGTLAIGGSGRITLGGANATVRTSALEVAAGGVVSGAGTISGDGGGNDTVMLTSIDNDGAIAAAGGDLLLYGGVSGTGALSVATGATLTLQTAVGSGQTLAFSPNARAVLNDARAFAGTITGFGAGDVLDIAGTDATSAAWSDGVLTLGTAFGAIRLAVSGNYASNGFTVQSDGLGGTNVTGGTGDVHMTTFDGLHYDFQALGDFVAVRSTEPANPWGIEIRTASAPGATSITTELAAQLGDDRVTFAVGRTDPVYIDGAADTTLQVGAAQSLADGTLARLSSATYRLTWNTGESVTVAVTGQGGWLDWSVGLGPHDEAGSVQGLLGSDSGQATDFQLPNGSVLPQPLSAEQILGGFADAWRVAPGGSLFDDRVPQNAPSLLGQYMAAMGGGATAGANDLPATLQGASRSADDLFAAAPPGSPFHA